MPDRTFQVTCAYADAPIAIRCASGVEALTQAAQLFFGKVAVQSSPLPPDPGPEFTVVMAGGGEGQRVQFDRSPNKTIVVNGPSRFIDALIAIRQGVSLWSSEAAEYLHMATLGLPKISSDAYAISGASGSGKSTLVAAIAELTTLSIRNEDWAPVDVTTATLVPTQIETHWHLKRETHALYRNLVHNAHTADPTDADRFFCQPRAFHLAPTPRVRAIVVIGPPTESRLLRPAIESDLSWIKKGFPSFYYGVSERWLDGSTMLFESREDERREARLGTLFSQCPTAVLRGKANPRQAAREVLKWFENGETSGN